MNRSLFSLVSILLLLCACRGGGDKSVSADAGGSLEYARSLQLIEYPEGWTEARISNPWDTARLLQRVAMVPRDLDLSSLNIPGDYVVVRTPLENSLVTSTVHAALVEELGAVEAIGGVTDVEYLKSEYLNQKLESGLIEECGSWLSPNVEKIIRLHPDAILISPYQNGGSYGNITGLGTPVVYVADYMENSPLGRAEWIRYYGRLYGRGETADSIFDEIKTRYTGLSTLCLADAALYGEKRVLMDVPYSGVWQVPVKGSTNDIFLTEAGAVNPFSDVEGDQFASFSPEKVLYAAHDADVWIIRQYSEAPLSLENLKAHYDGADRFKPFAEGNVWGANTLTTPYFEETPFHPERILEDLFHILHNPEPSDTLRYFIRLK